MKQKIWLSFLFASFFFTLLAQRDEMHIRGRVLEETDDRKKQPLIGVNVYWSGTQIGVTTDTGGYFTIAPVGENNHLVFSYIGYQNDTADASDNRFVTVVMKGSLALDEVKVVYRRPGMQISSLDPIKVEKINEKELLKAACCNLSESFETNPSVDVTYTDAVTGTKQIQMLGLAGPYTQITRENMPDVRGLSAIYGLTYIPGPWIQGIMLNKGTGSVVNGFESIAGQIDVHLRDPESMDPLYLNIYANEDGRVEANVALKADLHEHLGTALLLHGSHNAIRHDRNEDGFLDMPLSQQYIGLNRWELHNDNGSHVELGIKGLYIDNTGGEIDFYPDKDEGIFKKWGMKLGMKRLEGWAKAGRVNSEKPWQSAGLQLSGLIHQQDSYFGQNEYDAGQRSFYANLIYQGIFNNTAHKFRTGVSFQADHYEERLNDKDYMRDEILPGAFFEYTYSYLEKFNAVAGIRADHHNHYGLFFTPRLHLRYALAEKTILRASGGRGQRTASIFSENNALLASSRQLVVQGDGTSKPYGLEAEVAWNYGVNFTQMFKLDYREGTFSVDFYHTYFRNQIVIDLEQSPQQAVFYNLDGKSYSNSFQVQLDYELIKRFDLRLAYRWYDVKTTYSGELQQKPLVSRNRAFINMAYETRNHWKFDATVNGQGSKRIPSTAGNPEEYRLPERSPGFVVVNAHISKTWREKFDVYAGVENLFDYKQNDPILASEQPFSDYFDSSFIWGPVFGRNVYVGLRYRIK
ncbi:MAG: TonB-dependent receptor [Bacteroidales bacterium]|nr:TonB-dependent receptor [Bacteroidales bacterium]MBN2763948.1 TonB-dependent receptor [Bacteroidales bacterium]